MRKHTPGPWEALRGVDATDQTAITDGKTFIARIDPYSNTDANARLIAAAPELLEVAKMDQILAFNQVEEAARLLVPYGYQGTKLYVELCAFVDHKRNLAILKAEGRQS